MGSSSTFWSVLCLRGILFIKLWILTSDPAGELTLEEFIEGAKDHEDIMDMLKTLMDLTPVLLIIIEGRTGNNQWEKRGSSELWLAVWTGLTLQRGSLADFHVKKVTMDSVSCICQPPPAVGPPGPGVCGATKSFSCMCYMYGTNTTAVVTRSSYSFAIENLISSNILLISASTI